MCSDHPCRIIILSMEATCLPAIRYSTWIIHWRINTKRSLKLRIMHNASKSVDESVDDIGNHHPTIIAMIIAKTIARKRKFVVNEEDHADNAEDFLQQLIVLF